MAISNQYFEYVKNDYKDRFGNIQIHKIQPDIATLPVEMLLVKGHPLRKRINSILLKIISAGLIDFWSQQIKMERTRSNEKLDNKLDEDVVLSFYHLHGAFLVLICGWILSAICLLMEKVTIWITSIYFR